MLILKESVRTDTHIKSVNPIDYMPSSFKSTPKESILNSQAIFQVVEKIGREYHIGYHMCAKEIQEDLKKSQSSIAEILSLLEKNKIIKEDLEYKFESKSKFYCLNLEGILEFYFNTFENRDISKKMIKDGIKNMKESILFKSDFNDFVQKNVNADFIQTFQALFTYFDITFTRTYADIFEPLENFELKEIPKKIKKKYQELWVIWIIVTSINKYGEKLYGEEDFPSYSQIEKTRKNFLQDLKSK